MKIKLTSIYVDDLDKALRFYTEVLGFQKKADVRQGAYRWLTVVSPEERDGVELQLELNDNPAARTYQQAMFERGRPAAIFHVDDVQQEHDRMTAGGAEFTTPPNTESWGSVAVLDDTCGNLIQILAPAEWQ